MAKLFFSFIIIILSSISLIAGGPWNPSGGKGYFKFSEWWTVYDQHYTDTGMIDPNVTTGIFNSYVYAEYGLTDRWTAIFNGALISRNYMNNLRSQTTDEIIVAGEGITSLGDIDLGVKYGITRPGAQIPMALSIYFGIPTGKAVAGALENLQTGDGEFNQRIQFDFGKGFSLGKHPAYFSAYLGFNNRTNDFSDEFRYGAEFGLGLSQQKLWIAARLNTVESLKNGATAQNTTSTGIFANNTEFMSVELELNYYINQRLGVSVSAAGAIRAEIIAAAPSYSVGVFYDLTK